MDTEQKKDVMLLVGDFRPDVLDRWEKWASKMGYTVEQRQLLELHIMESDNPLVIMDSHGLNEAEFSPAYSYGLSAVAEGNRIHRELEKLLIIYDEVSDPISERMASVLIKNRRTPMMPIALPPPKNYPEAMRRNRGSKRTRQW